MTRSRFTHRRLRPRAPGARLNHRPARLGFEALEDRRLLVITVSATPNYDAASLESYGGPGDPSEPGFANVGRSSTTAATVIYLGGGWVLTANHVAIGNAPNVSPGGVYFGGVQYAVDTSTVHRLHNFDGSLADLKIFKVVGDPGLPAILPNALADAPPDVGQHVFMIGNGLVGGAEHFWNVNTSQVPWVWTEQSEPANPGPYDVAGYSTGTQRTIRWGENNVDSNSLFLAGVWGYTTQFDDLDYTGQEALTHEAQAADGDSGGAGFHFVNGRWVLSGVMIAISGPLSGQPAGTELLGSQTLLADLSFFRDEILETAGVLDRQLFYNNTVFDGKSAALNAADDGAIATDKVAYLPGTGQAGANSVTSSTSGINGLMIDLATNHGALSLADFSFRVGANNSPSTWATAPAPTGFTVRAGAGDGGSDRVEIAWPDGAIVNTWLEVKIKGNDTTGGFNTNTGLAASDVFYFGNKVGDSFSGGESGFFSVDATDVIDARNHQGVAFSITNSYDYNRDAIIDATDQIVARNYQGFLMAINVAGPSSPPAESGDAGDAEVDFASLALALVAASRPSDAAPRPATAAAGLPFEPGPRERIFAQLALADQITWVPTGDGLPNADEADDAPFDAVAPLLLDHPVR